MNTWLCWLNLQDNMAVILEKLNAIKTKHLALCSEVVEMSLAQKDTIDSIRISLANVMELIQHFHHTTEVEVHPRFKKLLCTVYKG